MRCDQLVLEEPSLNRVCECEMNFCLSAVFLLCTNGFLTSLAYKYYLACGGYFMIKYWFCRLNWPRALLPVKLPVCSMTGFHHILFLCQWRCSLWCQAASNGTKQPDRYLSIFHYSVLLTALLQIVVLSSCFAYQTVKIYILFFKSKHELYIKWSLR